MREASAPSELGRRRRERRFWPRPRQSARAPYSTAPQAPLRRGGSRDQPRRIAGKPDPPRSAPLPNRAASPGGPDHAGRPLPRRRGDRAGFDDLEQSGLNGVVERDLRLERLEALLHGLEIVA